MADFFEDVFDEERGEQRERRRQSSRRPWWQAAKTVRQGLIISALYFLLAAGILIYGRLASAPAANAVLAVGWFVLGAGYLGSSLALRRRNREAGLRPGYRRPSDRDSG